MGPAGLSGAFRKLKPIGMKRILMIFLCLYGILGYGQNNSPTVEIETGTIEGVFSEDGAIEKYLGIPFAKPPVGELRWAPPQKPDSWVGVKETKTYGKQAVTYRFADWVEFEEENLSEDCLYLNVWKPAGEQEGLPVLVQIHGGGFAAGTGAEARLEGSSMAREGMVVVSINYRLNIFGFFAHPELSKGSPQGASGNYGLMDQQLALQWVRDNIARFGGDPGRVTITGESAGSMSVLALMTSPLSKDLMAGAIGSSGGTIPMFPLVLAERNGRLIAENAGYTSLDQLRKASTAEILEIYKNVDGLTFFPVRDGYVLPANFSELYEAKQHADIPLILGWNSTEMPEEAYLGGNDFSKERFVSATQAAFPNQYQEILAEYPHETREQVRRSSAELASLGFIVPGAWQWFDLHRNLSEKPVYRYIFSKVHPPHSSVDLSTYEPPLGAYHAQEISYCWGNLDLNEGFEYTEEDYRVSSVMKQYMVNFIKTGNPNGEGLPEWPAQAGDSEPLIMDFDSETRLRPADKDYRIVNALKAMGQ